MKNEKLKNRKRTRRDTPGPILGLFRVNLTDGGARTGEEFDKTQPKFPILKFLADERRMQIEK